MPAIPTLRVNSIRKIYDDGQHNAFTDLCRFRDRFYLTFRSSPDGHAVKDTSRIVILSSADGRDWETVHAFSVTYGDTRDPHFLVFQDQLFVYTGVWICHPETGAFDMNDHVGYAAWSRDGSTWQGPRLMEGTYGHYVWRAAARGDTAYLCARRLRHHVPSDLGAEVVIRESALLESEDGLIWRFRSLFQETQGNETAFLFEDDGELLAVARTRSDQAQLCRSKPPYTTWTRRPLCHNVGGPLLASWGDRYLVGGRRLPTDDARTVLSWLIDDELVDVAELPSGGDTSYPGFVALSDSRGLLSYYSSHEGSNAGLPPCAIYLAELAVT